MSDEVTTTSEVKKTSDGNVKISLEKYEELLGKAAEKPPVIHRTVHKTAEMIAQEQRAWGATFMGLGASLFVVGAFLYKSGKG